MGYVTGIAGILHAVDTDVGVSSGNGTRAEASNAVSDGSSDHRGESGSGSGSGEVDGERARVVGGRGGFGGSGVGRGRGVTGRGRGGIGRGRGVVGSGRGVVGRGRGVVGRGRGVVGRGRGVVGRCRGVVGRCRGVVGRGRGVVDRGGLGGGDTVERPAIKYTFKGLFGLFYLLCCLTGQLTTRPRCGESLSKDIYKCCKFVASTLFLLVFGIVNIVSFVFDIYVIAWCPFEDCGYIYTNNNTNESNSMNYTATTASFGAPSAESQSQYDDWQKVVFTTATISGLLSYYLMVILVLCPLYGVCNPCSRSVCECVASIWRNCGEREARSSAVGETALNPFVDSNESEISTLLGSRQSFYFHLIFWANLLLFVANVGVLITILIDQIGSKNHLLYWLDIAGLATQFGSRFCAILSCFIFSKVVYAVSSGCLKMENTFAQVNEVNMRGGWNTFLNGLVNSNQHYLTDGDI